MLDSLGLADFEKAAKDAGMFSLDVETTGKNVRKDHLICISVAVKDRSWFIPVSSLPNSVPLVAVRDWFNAHIFNASGLKMIGHNIKYDLEVLIAHGFVVLCQLIDTMIAEWLCNETGAAPITADHGIFGLKELVKKYFGVDRPSWEEVRDLAFLAPKDFEQYSRDDSLDAWKLWEQVEEPSLAREGRGIQRIFWEMEMPLIPILIEMEMSGLYVDVDGLEKLLKENAHKIDELQQKIYKLVGKQFNIKSTEQLSDVLFNDLKLSCEGFPLTKKSTPEHPIYTVDKKYLKKLRGKHDVIPPIEEWRKQTTLRDVFLKKLLALAKESDTRRIYPEFKQTGTRIGRLSSENPNSQNMPRKGGIRDCVVAPEGKKLVVGDLNQIEYRILAHQSQDPVLVNAYRTGSDMHKATMDIAGVERTLAKNINFGLTYGMSVPSLAEFLGVSESRAQDIYDKVCGAFKKVPEYKTRTRYTVLRKQFVETIFGRRRRFHGLRMDEYNHRQAFHFTVSGSAADVIKIGMVKLYRALEERRRNDPKYREVKMLAQIHDELVLEAPIDIAEDVRKLVQSSMEDVGGGRLLVPVKAEVGIGATWSTAKH